MNFNEYQGIDLDGKSTKKTYKYNFQIPPDKVKKCWEIAKRRKDLHKNHASQRIYKKESEFIGILGECGFGFKINMEPDWSDRIGGDRYDFKIGDAFIDVKSTETRNGVSIRPEAYHKNRNFLYVMTRCNKETNIVSIVGWIEALEINLNIRDRGYNKGNYFVPEDHFKDIDLFEKIVNEINNNPNKTNYYKE